MNSWKRPLLRAALALLLAVLLIEVVSRVADGIGAESGLLHKLSSRYLDPGAARLQDARTIPHPYLGYVLKPSWHTAEGAAQQCSHNSLGFRGKETTWEKPAGTWRIVTSGGSSVYGQSETKDSAVWSQRLEDLLNQAGLSYRVEVINGGCSGYNLYENLINFETRLVDFHPDLLLHYEAINDMRCALYTRGGEVQRDNTHWRAAWPVDRPSSVERLLEHSRSYLVWRRFFTDYARLRADLGYWAIVNYDPQGDPYDPSPVPELGFASYQRNLVSLIECARAHGVQPLLVTQPLARFHLRRAPSCAKQLAGIDRIQEIERTVARERNVPLFECARIVEAAVDEQVEEETARVLAAEPQLEPAEARSRAMDHLNPDPLPKEPLPGVLFRAEVHPFDLGSELIARTIADYLLHSGVLPKTIDRH
jgi:lysophospholipase L1-like esterase